MVIPQAGCTAPGLSWQEGRGVAAGEATGLEIRPWLSRGYNQPEPSAVMALPASLPSTVDPLLCSRMECVSGISVKVCVCVCVIVCVREVFVCFCVCVFVEVFAFFLCVPGRVCAHVNVCLCVSVHVC